MIIKITTAKIYQFKSITFEFHRYCGPTFLRRKDWEPKPQQLRPMRDYAALAQWEKLNKDEREQYRIL